MRVLQICSKVPFPPKDGGCIAMHSITTGLLDAGHSVKVVALNTSKHYTEIEKIGNDYISKTKLETVFVDTEITIWGFIKSVFSPKSFNVDRFYSSKMAVKLAKILKSQEFDIIQVESIYVSQYMKILRRLSKAKIVLRAHNVEFEIWEKLADETHNQFKKIYYKRLAIKLKHYEVRMYNKFDGIAAITQHDADKITKLRCRKPIAVVPFGFEFTENDFISTNVLPSFFHIGAMDWQPNLNGIKWFVENIWHKVRNDFPDYKFHLAGRKMPDWLFEYNKNKEQNLVVIGEVSNAKKFMHNKSIMISPLHAGSGMRIKIIEAMALGKVVITTSLGAQGIEYEDKKNILIANDEYEFIAAMKFCVENPNEVENIGKNAQELVKIKYDNTVIAKKLTDFYHTI